MSTGHRPTVVRLPLVVAAADARGALDVDAARACTRCGGEDAEDGKMLREMQDQTQVGRTGDRGRRQAAVAAGLDLELDRLAILETAEAVRLDRRLRNEWGAKRGIGVNSTDSPQPAQRASLCDSLSTAKSSSRSLAARAVP